jgi:hypothetical protein
MAKENRFPDAAAMLRHEEAFSRWLTARGVPPRRRHTAVTRGLFYWPQQMAELCAEAGLPAPAQWQLDIYTFNIICITQYGLEATKRLKYHVVQPPTTHQAKVCRYRNVGVHTFSHRIRLSKSLSSIK